MAYNYNFSPYSNGNGYPSNRNYGRSAGSSFRPNVRFGYQSQGQQQQKKKHSGCTAGTGKNGKPYVQGWKFSRRSGLVKYFAAPYHSTHVSTSKTGQSWENWILKIQYENGQTEITPCLYSPSTRKITCQKLGLVMNPKGGRGGYTGRFFYRNS